MTSAGRRGENYAKKAAENLMEQIKRAEAPWQKPWKPGGLAVVENFLAGKKHTGEDDPGQIETEEADG